MDIEELQQIIEESRKLADKCSLYDADRSYQLERFADWIEDDINNFKYEEDRDQLWQIFLDLHDYDWKSMFPEGDEDDNITDFLTQD